MGDCLIPVRKYLDELSEGNIEHVQEYVDNMRDAIENGQDIDYHKVFDNLFRNKVLNKDKVDAHLQTTSGLIAMVKSDLSRGGNVAPTQRVADEVFIHQLTQSQIGLGVSDTLEARIKVNSDVLVHQLNKAIEVDGLDVMELTGGVTDASKKFFEVLGGNTKVEGLEAEAANRVLNILRDITKKQVDAGEIPSEALDGVFQGRVSFDSSAVSKMGEEDFVDFLDKSVDWEKTEERYTARNNDVITKAARKNYRQNKIDELVHHTESSREKDLRVRDRLATEKAKLNKALEDHGKIVDQGPELPKSLQNEKKRVGDLDKKLSSKKERFDQKIEAKKKSPIKVPESREVKKAQTAVGTLEDKYHQKYERLQKAKKNNWPSADSIERELESLDNSIHEAKIIHKLSKVDEAKAIKAAEKVRKAEISQLKLDKAEAIAKVNAERDAFQTRINEIKGKFKKDTKAKTASLEDKIAKTNEKIDKLKFTKEEIAKVSEMKTNREKNVMKEVENNMTDFDRKEFARSAFKDITISGSASKLRPLSLIHFKAGEMPNVLDKLSVNRNAYDHVRSHLRGLGKKMAVNERLGTNPSAALDAQAKLIKEHFNIEVSPRIVENAKLAYDPSLRRTGVETWVDKSLKGMRTFGNMTVLGRMVFSMIGENPALASMVSGLTDGNFAAELVKGYTSTVGGWITGMAKKDKFFLSKEGENFINTSVTLSSLDRKYGDAGKFRNTALRGVQDVADRLSGGISIDGSQRALGLGAVQTALNSGNHNKLLSEYIKAVGITSEDMLKINEAGGWGGVTIRDYAEKNFMHDAVKLNEYREVANKVEILYDQVSGRILARNNDRIRLKSGYNLRNDVKDKVMTTAFQYKQIAFEVLFNLEKLGVNPDDLHLQTALLTQNIFKATAKRLANKKVAYVLALATATNFMTQEARRRMQGEIGWGSDSWSSGDTYKGLVTSAVASFGGISFGMEGLLTGEFDAGNIALSLGGPSARHFTNIAGLLNSMGKNQFAGGNSDTATKMFTLMRQLTPLKTHLGFSIVLEMMYDSMNKSVNPKYYSSKRKKRMYQKRRGVEDMEFKR